MRIIGAADEFWRLRITRVDTTEGLDFEWHDDILYREARVRQPEEVETWHLEAVEFETDDVVRIASFLDQDEAHDALARANEDLRDMTKAQFEDAYLSADEDAEEPVEGAE